MNRVFVSHATIDKLFADALVHKLEQNGLRCWYAPRDIEPGAAWPAAISRAIREAPVMLLVFSAASNCSAEISRELALAAESHSLVVPVRIDNVEPGESLAYHLSGRHWLDVAGMGTDKATSHVLESLRRFNELTRPPRPHRAAGAGKGRSRFNRKPALAALLLFLLFGGGALWLGGFFDSGAAGHPEEVLYTVPGKNAGLHLYSERGDSPLLLGLLRLEARPGTDGEEYLVAARGYGGKNDGKIYRCQLVLEEGGLRYVLDLKGERYALLTLDQLGRGRFIPPGGEARLVYFDRRTDTPTQVAALVDDYRAGRKWGGGY